MKVLEVLLQSLPFEELLSNNAVAIIHPFLVQGLGTVIVKLLDFREGEHPLPKLEVIGEGLRAGFF